MRKYNSYKDSGIEWLGEIPKHWEIKRVKDVGEYQSGSYIDAADFDDQFGYPVFGGNGLRGYCNDYNLSGDYILIGRQGALCGNINYVSGKIWVTEHAIIVSKKKNLNLVWLGELFRVMNFNQYSISAAQPGLAIDRIKRLELPIPPIDERDSIGLYLIDKTQAIDKKVELLEQKIQHYKDLRKSLVNKVVTKGLGKKVKLKDSSVDWIGKIPAHWELERLKHLGNLETSSVNKKIDQDEVLIKLVNYMDVYNNDTKEIWNSENYMVVSANNLQIQSKKLKKGDVLFTPSSETVEDIGVSAVVMENLNNTLYSYHILRLRFSKKMDDSFKKYMFNNDFVQTYFSKTAKGTTRKILGLNDFNNLSVVIPPITEQIKIGKFLDTKTNLITSIISNIEAQITILKELRKTLINDVVTGKINVLNN